MWELSDVLELSLLLTPSNLGLLMLILLSMAALFVLSFGLAVDLVLDGATLPSSLLPLAIDFACAMMLCRPDKHRPLKQALAVTLGVSNLNDL